MQSEQQQSKPLEWISVPSIFPEIEAWGATKEPFQYMMSYDRSEYSWSVSAKAYPNAGPRIDLGRWISRHKAIQACENHWKKGKN